MKSIYCWLIGWFFLGSTLLPPSTFAQQLLVESESFTNRGGWQLDTQFIETMGSPYLLAHGLGRPVADATTQVNFPETGTYRVWVRTKDWVARWNAPGKPGRFQLLIDGQPMATTFGTESAEWAWQDGGEVEIANKLVTLSLRDLTGFEGRCDAIYFSAPGNKPPNDKAVLPEWRRKLLGISERPIEKSNYDLVVIGGGYSGLGAAISAARSGCRVALVQNRPVLGGNGSSEVRVWAQGLIRRGKYPRVGEIIEELADKATKSPGSYEEFEDDKKEAIVRAEKNIDLFLNHHAYAVDISKESNQVVAVEAFDTRTSEIKRFTGKLFVDATGHGSIGFLAGADWEMTPKGRMGMSNMWAWAEGDEPSEFPETPWALDLTMADFPYPRDYHGQWFWESGFDKDPINEAEAIRDWNFRAVYGAFNAMKNRDGAAKHKNAYLTWLAFIGGPRESRRLLGDVILTQDDIVNKKEFEDGCVPSTWSIDLHYPKKQYAKKFADNPFISIAVHDRRIDRSYGYPVPYRCFYSRTVPNLFMAGRCISVTHEALGTTRVMKTCGMMGEVVGRAASICIKNGCLPRDVYTRYWPEMEELLKLPGKARRASVTENFVIPADAMKLASPQGIISGIESTKLRGIVVDDRAATKTGKWTAGDGLKQYIDWGYLYASPTKANETPSTISFVIQVEEAGTYEAGIAFQPHPNRSRRTFVTAAASGARATKPMALLIDMSKKPSRGKLDKGFHSLGEFNLSANEKLTILITTTGADGIVHADAAQVVRIKPAGSK